MARFSSIWAAALLFGLVSAPLPAASQPANVGASTSIQATQASGQRRTFYDRINQRHWSFFYNGSAIEYSYSADGNNWASAGTLPYDTLGFTVVNKDISNQAYVFLAVETNNYDIVLRRGLLGSSAIAFDSEILVFDGSGAADSYQKPSAALNAANELWIAAVHDAGGSSGFNRYMPFAVRSQNSADADLSLWNTASPVGRRTLSSVETVLLPHSGSELYLLQSTDSGNVVSYHYDGSSWSAANQDGDYAWLTYGNSLGPNYQVTDIEIVGSDIYIAGDFTKVGGVEGADYIARWDGSAWHAVAPGLTNTVYDIAFLGSELYAGGYFQDAGGVAAADYIARWDGSSWSALGSGINYWAVEFVVNGTDLYVGGGFTNAGGIADADRLARWDGSAWHAVAPGIDNGRVYAIDINGSEITIGGWFSNLNGIPEADNIAHWDGSAWSALGIGLNGAVNGLARVGSDLYVGGNFTNAANIAEADRAARWDGSAWHALGTGIPSGYVYRMAVHGSNVYFGGGFGYAGGVSGAACIAYWDGSSWNSIGSSAGYNVRAIAFDGSDIYLGGDFGTLISGDSASARFIKWNGSGWETIIESNAKAYGFNGTIRSIHMFNSELYVGGYFTDAFGNPDFDYLIKWDGSSWSALTPALNGGVTDMLTYNSELVIIGGFWNVGGFGDHDSLLRRVGNSWTILGAGLSGSPYDIEVWNGDLYVAGGFNNHAGIPEADRIARWDGSSWHALGSGLNSTASTLAGDGSYLYVGGSFTNAGNIAEADRIAAWDGSSWSALGNGANGGIDSSIIYNGELYIGGWHSSRLSKWDGSAWEAVGGGVTSIVYDMEVWNGSLYIGGLFENAGGIAEADFIARWDGTSFHAVGSGVTHEVRVVTAVGNDLYLGGNFSGPQIPGINSAHLIRYTPVAFPNASTAHSTASVTDANGDLHLLAVDTNNDLFYRSYDASAGAWLPRVQLNTASASSPSISVNTAANVLYAYWLEGSELRYKTAAAPYAAGDWSSASILHSTGTNSHVSAQVNDGLGGMLVSWTNGSGAPYAVFADTIQLTHDISGTAALSGTGLSGAAIDGAALGARTTAADGSYSFTGIPHLTPYSLTPVLAGHTFTPSSYSGVLAADAVVDFSAALNLYTITGTVTDGADPLANVSLELSGDVTSSTTTDASGAYTLSNLPYGSSYTLTPSIASHSFTPQTGTISADVVHNFEGTINAVGSTVQGRVLRNGQPVAEAIVKLVVQSGLSQVVAIAVTNAEGEYSFAAVPPGSYTVVAEKSGLVISETTVDVVEHGVDVGVELPTHSQSSLSTPAYTFWNTYLSMQNILELRNKGNEPLRADIHLLSGTAGGLLASETVALEPGAQLDLHLNSFQGLPADSYGMVKVSTSHELFDGGVTIYRLSDTEAGDYDYAYHMPFRIPESRSSYLLYNTFHPQSVEGAAHSPVLNWLTLANPNAEAAALNVRYYSDSGRIEHQFPVHLPAYSRIDLDGGHHILGTNRAGLIEVSASVNGPEFLAALTRIGTRLNAAGFSFAFASSAAPGSGSEQHLPITALDDSASFVEIANTQNSPAAAALTVYNHRGIVEGTNVLQLPGKSTRHIALHTLMAQGSFGTLSIDSDSPEALIASEVSYYYSPDGVLLSAESSRPLETIATTLSGSFNLYLGMANWLRLINPSDDSASVILDLRPHGSELLLTINPHARHDIALHEMNLRSRSYGSLSIIMGHDSTVAAQLIRVRPDSRRSLDFITASPVR